MMASFLVIPYLTIYITTNVGLRTDQIPLLYLCGGVATFFTARLWGVLADRWGKVRTFRLVALCSLLPILTVTHLSVVPLPVLLVVTTAFFVFVSGRMVPGMAIVTSAAQPQWRGTFLSLNASLQSAATGVAALVGGMLIGRGPEGLVQGYNHAGWVAAATTMVVLALAGRVGMHQRSAVVHSNQ
jgi:predicted MFS family arabinose efflux permease